MFQKTLMILAGLGALAVLGFASTTAGDTINSTCPISKKAVDGSTTSKVGDSEVGFCCGRCKGAFDACGAVLRLVLPHHRLCRHADAGQCRAGSRA
jgi:hypothetical protein